jgi:hypothetical protein
LREEVFPQIRLMLRNTFVHRGPLHTEATGLTFSLYSAEEVEAMSVVKVVTPLSFNALGHALPGGLYDPKMGTYGGRAVNDFEN